MMRTILINIFEFSINFQRLVIIKRSFNVVAQLALRLNVSLDAFIQGLYILTITRYNPLNCFVGNQVQSVYRFTFKRYIAKLY